MDGFVVVGQTDYLLCCECCYQLLLVNASDYSFRLIYRKDGKSGYLHTELGVSTQLQVIPEVVTGMFKIIKPESLVDTMVLWRADANRCLAFASFCLCRNEMIIC